MMEFYSEKTPIAQKEHKCEMCGGVIQVGEKYTYQSGKFYGEFFSRKLHTECDYILTDFLNETGENEFCYDEISDWWSESYCWNCKHDEDNGGECDRDKDRVCWCSKFEGKDINVSTKGEPT